MDRYSPAERRSLMAKVRSKDTHPELVVRRLTHGLGYRYRLHVRSVPGSPDLVFPARRKVIFVHGCFWHRHQCRRGRSMPATNRAFWEQKFKRNRERDRQIGRVLSKDGWKVLVVWECQLKDMEALAHRLVQFLESPVA